MNEKLVNVISESHFCNRISDLYWDREKRVILWKSDIPLEHEPQLSWSPILHSMFQDSAVYWKVSEIGFKIAILLSESCCTLNYAHVFVRFLEKQFWFSRTMFKINKMNIFAEFGDSGNLGWFLRPIYVAEFEWILPVA